MRAALCRSIALFFQSLTGTRFQLIPYRGAGPVMQDLLAGHLDFGIESAATVLPQVQAGTVKALRGHGQAPPRGGAQCSDRRRGRAAGLLHRFGVRDLGAEGHTEGDHWQAQCGYCNAFADPAAQARFVSFGQEVVPREQQTPEALGAWHKAEIEKWWPIIKAAGIKIE